MILTRRRQCAVGTAMMSAALSAFTRRRKNADFNIASTAEQDFFIDKCVHVGDLFDSGDFACPP